MAVTIVEEQVEKTVDMMTNPQIEFVSLVRHGANRMPFRVVKSQDKGGEPVVTLAVQSILLPNGQDISALAGKEGQQWVADARVDKAEQYEGYKKLVQTEEKAFDIGSLQLMSLGKGAVAIVGKLEQSVPDALTVSTQVAKEMPTPPLYAPMDSHAVTMAPSFGDVMEQELYSMMDVVYGALKQATSDAKQRKSVVLGAVENFKTFLATALDSIGTEKVELKALKDEGGPKKMFNTKEEFVAGVAEVVGPMLEKFGETLKKDLQPAAPEAPPTEVKTEEVAQGSVPDIATIVADAVKAAMAPYAEKLDQVAQKTENIGQQVTTQPAAAESETPEPVVKTEKVSIFSGLLTGQAIKSKTQAAYQ